LVKRPEFQTETLPDRKVMFTNRDNNNLVNKRASHLLFGEKVKFLNNVAYVDLQSRIEAEKSTLDVYEAFARDFDALDDGPEPAFERPIRKKQ
jgi:hypothetical protein